MTHPMVSRLVLMGVGNGAPSFCLYNRSVLRVLVNVLQGRIMARELYLDAVARCKMMEDPNLPIDTQEHAGQVRVLCSNKTQETLDSKVVWHSQNELFERQFGPLLCGCALLCTLFIVFI